MAVNNMRSRTTTRELTNATKLFVSLICVYLITNTLNLLLTFVEYFYGDWLFEVMTILVISKNRLAEGSRDSKSAVIIEVLKHGGEREIRPILLRL